MSDNPRKDGMRRVCKLFISSDSTGLLYDATSISDVVNFHGYEDVVKSTRQIIAIAHGIRENDVILHNLCYYKRRARSTRMNPAPLTTTTDVFRALAEHPKGEVPIGVHWSRKSDSQNAKKHRYHEVCWRE